MALTHVAPLVFWVKQQPFSLRLVLFLHSLTTLITCDHSTPSTHCWRSSNYNLSTHILSVDPALQKQTNEGDVPRGFWDPPCWNAAFRPQPDGKHVLQRPPQGAGLYCHPGLGSEPASTCSHHQGPFYLTFCYSGLCLLTNQVFACCINHQQMFALLHGNHTSYMQLTVR